MRQRTTRLLILTAASLAPGCDDRPVTCATANYAVCGSPLSAAQNDGSRWPTFSQALAAAGQCGGDGGEILGRGSCSDGKRFIARFGSLVGEAQYFEGETLVGRVSYTDVGFGPCQCPFERFQGTLESVRCEVQTFEALCGTRQPENLDAPFAQGTASCSCDE